MRKPAARYIERSIAHVDARQTEIAAFSRINRELTTAKTPAQRIRALGRNHDLWALLLNDLGQTGNRLPPPLRELLMKLAVWSMRYSIHANLLSLPVQPLVNVNTNILEGLQAQAAQAAANAATREVPRTLAV